MSPNPDDSDGGGRVPVARILAPRGLRGEVKVVVEPGVFDSLGGMVSLAADTGDSVPVPLEIEAVSFHGSSAVIKFKGVDDRDAALALRGSYLTVARSALPVLGENRYFRSELVGMNAVDPDGRTLGTITRVDEFPAHDVIVIDTGDSDVWVPAVAEFVLSVDTVNRRIVVARSDEFPPQAKESKG